MKITLAFETREKEALFSLAVAGKNEEIGGILFYHWGRVADLHWKRHTKLFGEHAIGLITDWLIVPNVSNLRETTYKVSDLDQVIGIAEYTAQSKDMAYMHFHSHPSKSTQPSPSDMAFWLSNFSRRGIARGVVVADSDFTKCGVDVICHSTDYRGQSFDAGHFLEWDWIRYRIRKDAEERQKKEQRKKSAPSRPKERP